jgi:hypothetical protein
VRWRRIVWTAGLGIALGPAVRRADVGAVPVGAVPVGAVRPADARLLAGRHDLHVSSTRIVVDGASVIARMRIFRDDLAKATGRELASDAAGQAAFGKYLAAHFTIRGDGVPLSGQVMDAGAEADDGGEKMFWYVVQFTARQPVRRLAISNQLLFELFRDQQNLVTILKAPGDNRWSLYFAAGDTKEQVVVF